MTIAFISVLTAFLINYLPKIPTAIAMYRLDNRYDNNYPRDQQSRLTGFGKRAYGAHMNSFGIFPAFAASVIISHISIGSSQTVDHLSIFFIITRLIYIGLYLVDLAWIRSVVWATGFFIVVLIFLSPIYRF